MTVQWDKDPASQGRGQKSRLGTSRGTSLCLANDIPVHNNTVSATP